MKKRDRCYIFVGVMYIGKYLESPEYRGVMVKYRKYLVVAALVFVYLGSIWQRPMFTPDEFRYAEITREMIVSGDWILPRQMGYWLNAVAELICGDRPMAVRLFPAIATLLSAGVIWMLCRRAGERQLGVVAPVIYLTTGLVFAIGTYGVLDAPFAFFLLWSVAATYFAWSETKPGRRAGYLALAGVGCGLAFLSKGLLAVVLPGGALRAVPDLAEGVETSSMFL